MLLTVRAEKVDEKMLSFVQFPFFLPDLLSLNCVFLQFCADLSKKSKPVQAIYIYVSKSSHYIFSENGMVYRYSMVLAIKILKKMLNQQKFNKILRL